MFRFSSDMQGRESLYVGLYVVEISEPFRSCLYTHTCNVWREWQSLEHRLTQETHRPIIPLHSLTLHTKHQCLSSVNVQCEKNAREGVGLQGEV